jgi:predicted flap endonuclease-1-like 5' DNA nuclease/regulator of replication initiation timing
MFEQNPMLGPGSAGIWNHTIEILLLLFGAFLLGYMLRWAISRLQIEKLQRELDVERRHRRAIEGDFDRIRSEHSAMGARISTLEGDVNRERAELADNKQKLLHSDGQISALRNDLAAFPNQLELLNTERETLRAENKKLSDELAACRQRAQALDANKQQAGQHDAELNDLRSKLSRLNALDSDLLSARTDLSTALAGRDAMRVEIDRLQSELDALRAAPKPKAAPAKADDLKVVEGIGPKINELLLAAGIRTFAELAETPVDRLKQILHEAGERFRIHDPSTWPQQAALCAQGAWDELRVLQDRLVAGRNG